MNESTENEMKWRIKLSPFLPKEKKGKDETLSVFSLWIFFLSFFLSFTFQSYESECCFFLLGIAKKTFSLHVFHALLPPLYSAPSAAITLAACS